MTKSITYIAIQLFIPFISLCQIITGTVKDKETNIPVPYAAIINLESQGGTYSDSLGRFKFLVDNNKFLKIQFSRVGYKSQIINFDDSQSKNIEIQLEPNITQLDEIKVTSKKNSFAIKSLGYFQKVRGLYTFDFNPNRAARLMTFINTENILNDDAVIKTLRYRLSSRKSKNTTSYRLRLRVLDDKNGSPNSDILKNDIIVDISTSEDIIEYDIEKLNLKLPKYGFWIGFDIIGYTDTNGGFNLLNTMKHGNSKINISPWIAMQKGNGSSLQSLWGNKWFSSKQTYHIFMFGIEYIVPR